MCVARQDAAGVLRRAGRRTPAADRRAAASICVDRFPLPEPQIGRHLVVPAAGGVELPADVAEPVDQRPLDVQVDVFEFDLELETALLNFLANRF